MGSYAGVLVILAIHLILYNSTFNETKLFAILEEESSEKMKGEVSLKTSLCSSTM